MNEEVLNIVFAPVFEKKSGCLMATVGNQLLKSTKQKRPA